MNTEYVLVSAAVVAGCAVGFIFRRIKTAKDRRDSNRIYEFLRRCTKDGQYTFRGSEEISTVTNLSPSRIADLCGKHRYIEGKDRQRHTWRVRDELLKQDSIAPKSAADQPVFGFPVPNYNTPRPRVQSRWDFVLRWRKAIFPENWRLPQRKRHGKNQLDAIWEALSRMNTNINVTRSTWRRRAQKDVKIRDLMPLADVKGGGGAKSESKPTAGGSGSTGSSGATGTKSSH